MPSRIKPLSQRSNYALVLLIPLFFSWYFFQIRTSNQPFWDEMTYVNAARSYLVSSKPFPNPEHPPFAKLLILVGMKLWGDAPEGWRFFSALAGALSGTMLIALTLHLTKRLGVALFCGALFLLDPLLYVHFRLGMLDPPLLVFLLAATALALKIWEAPKLQARRCYWLGLFLGLALATKMLTLVLMPAFWSLVLARCWKEKSLGKLAPHLMLSAIVLPGLIYLGAYRILGYTPGEVWDLTVYNFGYHHFHRGAEQMGSRWYEWLYVGRPNWYYYQQIDADHIRAILGTGNLVLWIGAELLAVYALLRRYRDPETWFLASLPLIQLALYCLKPVTFLQYMVTILPYFYLLMGLGIADLFQRFEWKHRRLLQIDFACFFVAALAVFFHYWPYIHGQPMTLETFHAVSVQGPPLSMP